MAGRIARRGLIGLVADNNTAAMEARRYLEISIFGFTDAANIIQAYLLIPDRLIDIVLQYEFEVRSTFSRRDDMAADLLCRLYGGPTDKSLEYIVNLEISPLEADDTCGTCRSAPTFYLVVTVNGQRTEVIHSIDQVWSWVLDGEPLYISRIDEGRSDIFGIDLRSVLPKMLLKLKEQYWIEIQNRHP